ncbi:DUF262 domain-containing protein [Streptomyces sp. NPDC048506]|uniref:GmrSD restriction endonuclease domain-containing protein n=1 Tax=Streptomyces sp. NPDC048506 TaxID=3155028 RepID=UPI0034252E13
MSNSCQWRAQQFQIPLYQRTYSWSERQLAQLWNDILEQAELVESDAAVSTHFLGSVVLAPSPQNEATFPRWLVVDGQQRLTTLSLALVAIRDHIAECQPDEAERIDEEYLINKRKKGADYFRLLPTQADRPQYAAHIHCVHSEQASGDRVAAAYRFFRRKLVEADDPASPQDALHIEQAITSRLTLVSVTAERGDNVHRIFESLNNTGLKLSQADLLRNYLFMRLPTRGEHVYETLWLPLQASLSNDELEQLMWLQLVLDGDDRVRRQDLYAAQQQRFERNGTSGAQTEADVAALPHGTWTSYGDLAAFIGSGAQAVGNHLARTEGVVNAYRVLNADGKIAEGFQWTGQDGGDVRARLRADGIRFTASGAADPAQRLTSDDLALLLADPNGEDEQDAAGEGVEGGRQRDEESRAARFLRQLAADDAPATVAAVQELFTRWEKLGGWVGHGAGEVTTSAFLMLGQAGSPGRGVWPLTLYPGSGRGGVAEVVFQHLANREPFTDRALRAELLAKVNELEGVSIPEGKLDLRPSFRLSVLEDDRNRELLFELLAWFRDRWEGRDAV